MCPRPCRPHPCRRRPIFRQCGSARWFGRSFGKPLPFGSLYLTEPASARQRMRVSERNSSTSASRALFAVGRAHCILARAGCGQHFVKGRVASKFCQQRIGKQIFVRAIVLLDGALEQVERRLLLAAIGKEDSLVVPRLRVGVGGWLLSASCAIRSRSWRGATGGTLPANRGDNGARPASSLLPRGLRQSCLRAAAARASHSWPIPNRHRDG